MFAKFISSNRVTPSNCFSTRVPQNLMVPWVPTRVPPVASKNTKITADIARPHKLYFWLRLQLQCYTHTHKHTCIPSQMHTPALLATFQQVLVPTCGMVPVRMSKPKTLTLLVEIWQIQTCNWLHARSTGGLKLTPWTCLWLSVGSDILGKGSTPSPNKYNWCFWCITTTYRKMTFLSI